MHEKSGNSRRLEAGLEFQKSIDQQAWSEDDMRCDPCPNPNEICSCRLHPDYKKAYAMNSILEDVSEKYGLSKKTVLSNSRKQEVVRARNIAMRRCRILLGATYQQIGQFFNRRHSTVIHSLKNGKST